MDKTRVMENVPTLDPSPEFIGPWGTSGDPGQPRLWICLRPSSFVLGARSEDDMPSRTLNLYGVHLDGCFVRLCGKAQVLHLIYTTRGTISPTVLSRILSNTIGNLKLVPLVVDDRGGVR
ncbi:hypothetical protein Tco_0818352 [Tanacetum coccineum]